MTYLRSLRGDFDISLRYSFKDTRKSQSESKSITYLRSLRGDFDISLRFSSKDTRKSQSESKLVNMLYDLPELSVGRF